MLFISSQSFKELRECASLPPTACRVRETPAPCRPLSALLILFSAERSCQRSAKRSAADPAARGKEGGRKIRQDECVYPCEDKGERIEPDGAEEAVLCISAESTRP